MPGPGSQGAGRWEGSWGQRGPGGGGGRAETARPFALCRNAVRMGRAGWAVGWRSRIDGKGPCWPTAREGRWFLGDAVHGADFRKQRAPDTCPIKEACRRQRGRPTRPTPASRKDGSSLLLQGRARPRPSPRVRAVRPAFEGEHTQLLTDAPRAPLETDVPKSRRSLLLLSHRPEAAAVPCISSEEDRAAPRGRPAPTAQAGPPAAERDRPAPRPPRRKEATECGGAGADPDFICCGSLVPVYNAEKPEERKQLQ